jgi:hypothetical protein
MALERPPVAAPAAFGQASRPESEASFDERWAAWQAKGAAQDRAFRRKLALTAPVAIIVLAAIVFVLLR